MKFLRPKGLPGVKLAANHAVLSLNEQIAQEARRRDLAEVRQRFRASREVHRTSHEVRPGADLADGIVAAYNKARKEQGDDDDPHDDDAPGKDDDRSNERGPDQTRTVATADAIIAAMRKAANEL